MAASGTGRPPAGRRHPLPTPGGRRNPGVSGDHARTACPPRREVSPGSADTPGTPPRRGCGTTARRAAGGGGCGPAVRGCAGAGMRSMSAGAAAGRPAPGPATPAAATRSRPGWNRPRASWPTTAGWTWPPRSPRCARAATIRSSRRRPGRRGAAGCRWWRRRPAPGRRGGRVRPVSPGFGAEQVQTPRWSRTVPHRRRGHRPVAPIRGQRREPRPPLRPRGDVRDRLRRPSCGSTRRTGRGPVRICSTSSSSVRHWWRPTRPAGRSSRRPQRGTAAPLRFHPVGATDPGRWRVPGRRTAGGHRSAGVHPSWPFPG